MGMAARPAACLNQIFAWLAQAEGFRLRQGRPLVSLCYAQSLDGSLTARRGEPLALSGPESLRLTHRLRAAHTAILVGIGTVLADDPSLTVRHAEGEDPQPVILDSHLRFPLEARLLQSGPARPQRRAPWIATTSASDPARRAALEAAGARLLVFEPGEQGSVSLPALLKRLGAEGAASVMVEGGARVISSFLRLGLADLAVVTIAPLFVGGLPVFDGPQEPGCFPRLRAACGEQMGEDWIVSGRLGDIADEVFGSVL